MKGEAMEAKMYAYVHSYEKKVVDGKPIVKLTVSDSDKQPTKTIEGPLSTIIEFFEENTDGELPSEDGKSLYKLIWTRSFTQTADGKLLVKRERALRIKLIRAKKMAIGSDAVSDNPLLAATRKGIAD